MPEPGSRRVDHASRLPWLAAARDARTQRRKRTQFRTLAEARAWRQEVQATIRKAEIRVTVTPTLCHGRHMNLGADETAAEVTRFIEKHDG